MIGWSLSIFLLGVAIGQLVYGPASQRFAKKAILIISLANFSVATIICAITNSVELLLVGRFIQSLGAAGQRLFGNFLLSKNMMIKHHSVFLLP